MILKVFANSVDPDQTAPIGVANCLPVCKNRFEKFARIFSRRHTDDILRCRFSWHFIVLRFYGPVNPMGSCRARSVYITTCLLGRLSPLKRLTGIVHILSPETDNCPS